MDAVGEEEPILKEINCKESEPAKFRNWLEEHFSSLPFISSWEKRFKDWCFRGQGDSTWDLIPSAFRPSWQTVFIPGTTTIMDIDHQVDKEFQILHEFMDLADEIGLPIPDIEHVLHKHEEILTGQKLNSSNWPPKELIEALAFAQHHHMPTRLLDFSYNALVALHFAAESAYCKENDKKPPRYFSVWAINLSVIRELWPPSNPENRRLVKVDVSYARNLFLLVQQGLFIYDKGFGKDDFKASISKPIKSHFNPLNKVLYDEIRERPWVQGRKVKNPAMIKISIPIEYAGNTLSWLCHSKNISKARLMPAPNNIMEDLKFRPYRGVQAIDHT